MCIRMISLSYIKEIFIKKIDIIMENQVNVMPRIGEKAPSFEAVTTQGKINFPSDYAGKWIILFSHPADFTPVCTSEFMTFGKMSKDFLLTVCIAILRGFVLSRIKSIIRE